MTTSTSSFSPVRIGQVDFVNLTPHAIVLREADGADHTIPPSGEVALIGAHSVPSNDPLFVRVDADSPVGWENFANWVISQTVSTPSQRIVGVVSSMFLDDLGLTFGRPVRVPWWLMHFLVSPLTDGTEIRNDKGHILAVRGFRTKLMPWEFNFIGLSPHPF